jgi:hypothetical protein
MRHRVMTSWTRLRPWFTPSEEAVRRWVVMQSLVTIVTLPLVLWQVYDLSEQRTGREISALMALDQRLDLEGSRAIRHRLYASKPMPLLRPDGPTTPESLDDFLDTFESLAALWQPRRHREHRRAVRRSDRASSGAPGDLRLHPRAAEGGSRLLHGLPRHGREDRQVEPGVTILTAFAQSTSITPLTVRSRAVEDRARRSCRRP